MRVVCKGFLSNLPFFSCRLVLFFSFWNVDLSQKKKDVSVQQEQNVFGTLLFYHKNYVMSMCKITECQNFFYFFVQNYKKVRQKPIKNTLTFF